MLTTRDPDQNDLNHEAETVKVGPALSRKRIVQVSVALAVIVLVGVLWTILHDCSSVALPDENVGLKIFDRQNRLVCTLMQGKEFSPVPLSRISKYVRQAIIAAEDHGFYQHDGVSFESIIRATFANIRAGHVVQGGSTITQQLIKNLYFSGEKRTMLGKFNEAMMALALDHRYSKDKILETYLNHVYFGRGSYGIEQASQKYFGVPASQLDLAQAAFLAGLVNAPSHLSIDKADARARQDEILDSMAKIGDVTPEAVAQAKSERITFKGATTRESRYGYYLNYVVSLLEHDFSKQVLWNEGTKIYTCLDTSAQIMADQILTQAIEKAPMGVSQGALVSIAVNDGSVIAMVGGVGSADQSPWNRATAPHTAGSALKPFVYLAALISGVLRPDSIIDDAPLTLSVPGSAEGYSPRNFEGDYLGPMTVRKALALSRNTCAVRVGAAVGPANIAATAYSAGITSKLDPSLSLALGSSAVTPLDMATSYATLARSGVWMAPKFIRMATTRDDKLLKQYTYDQKKVFNAEPVAELVDALQDVVRSGTGTRARLVDRPVAGKTGTADGSRDIWFVGFTPDTVTAVWAGNDQDQPIAGYSVTGGSIMAGIWQTFMRSYYRTHLIPIGSFPAPQALLAEDLDEARSRSSGLVSPIDHFLDPTDFSLSRGTDSFGQDLRASQKLSTEKQQSRKGGIKKFFGKLLRLF